MSGEGALAAGSTWRYIWENQVGVIIQRDMETHMVKRLGGSYTLTRHGITYVTPGRFSDPTHFKDGRYDSLKIYVPHLHVLMVIYCLLVLF